MNELLEDQFRIKTSDEIIQDMKLAVKECDIFGNDIEYHIKDILDLKD